MIKKFLLRSFVPVLACALFGAIGIPLQPANAAQQTTASEPSSTTQTPAQKRAANESKSHAKEGWASAGDIASARAKGMVWVNTQSRVYHTGGRYYGHTRHGQFMSLAGAKAAGYKPAKR